MSSVVDLNPVHTLVVRTEVPNPADVGSDEDCWVATRRLGRTKRHLPTSSDAPNLCKCRSHVRRVEQSNIRSDPHIAGHVRVNDNLLHYVGSAECSFDRERLSTVRRQVERVGVGAIKDRVVALVRRDDGRSRKRWHRGEGSNKLGHHHTLAAGPPENSVTAS